MEFSENNFDLYGAHCPICNKVGYVEVDVTRGYNLLEYFTRETYSFKCANCGFEAYEPNKDFLTNRLKGVDNNGQ